MNHTRMLRRRVTVIGAQLLIAAISGCAAPPLAVTKPLQPAAAAATAASPHLIPVPDVRQSTDYTCGPSALQSVLAYWGIEEREDELAKKLKTSVQDGTYRKNIVKLAQTYGLKVTVGEPMGIDALKSHLQRGVPVILSIQAYRDANVDYRTDWDDGHYVVAIGYDADSIYFEDPSLLASRGVMTTAELLDRWHDEDSPNDRYQQFGVAIEGKQPHVAPAIVHLD